MEVKNLSVLKTDFQVTCNLNMGSCPGAPTAICADKMRDILSGFTFRFLFCISAQISSHLQCPLFNSSPAGSEKKMTKM